MGSGFKSRTHLPFFEVSICEQAMPHKWYHVYPKGGRAEFIWEEGEGGRG